MSIFFYVEHLSFQELIKTLQPKYKMPIDETIIHYIKYKNAEYIQVRPYLDDFIKELSQFYEIIIFTASYQNYADLAINGIDPENKIEFRLYRQHND